MRAAEEKKLGDCSTIFGFFAFPGTTRLNFGPPAAPCKPREPGRRPPAAQRRAHGLRPCRRLRRRACGPPAPPTPHPHPPFCPTAKRTHDPKEERHDPFHQRLQRGLPRKNTGGPDPHQPGANHRLRHRPLLRGGACHPAPGDELPRGRYPVFIRRHPNQPHRHDRRPAPARGRHRRCILPYLHPRNRRHRGHRP